MSTVTPPSFLSVFDVLQRAYVDLEGIVERLPAADGAPLAPSDFQRQSATDALRHLGNAIGGLTALTTYHAPRPN